MARRKSRKVRTVTRTVAKSRSRGKKRSTAKPEQMILPAMVYGGAREKISTALIPITNKIPLGSIADELVLGTAGYMIAKKSKNKNLKQVGQAMLIVESARLGEAVVNGEALNFFTNKKAQSNTMNSF